MLSTESEPHLNFSRFTHAFFATDTPSARTHYGVTLFTNDVRNNLHREMFCLT
jgi:hypothetical protein